MSKNDRRLMSSNSTPAAKDRGLTNGPLGTGEKAGTKVRFQLPTWPQQFELSEGENQAVFAFPLTDPGAIVATINIKGGAAKIALVDPAGKTIKRGNALSSRLTKLSYPSPNVHNKHGLIWKIVITRLGANDKRSLEGEITVETPPVNEEQVRKYLEQAFKRPPMPSVEEATAKHLAAIQKSIDLSNKPQKAQAEAMMGRIRKQIQKVQIAESARVAKNVRKQQKVIAASLQKPSRGTWSYEGPALSESTIKKQYTLWQRSGGGGGGGGTEFALVNVVPNIGYQGDTVVITGTGLSTDKSLLRVFFNIAPASEYPPDGVNAEPKVVSVNSTGVAMEITVRVPHAPPDLDGPGILQPYCGSVFVFDEGIGGFTNRIDFTYIPNPVPAITSVTNASTGGTEFSLGTLLKIEGRNFGDLNGQNTQWQGSDGTSYKQGTVVNLRRELYPAVDSLTIEYFSDSLILARTTFYETTLPLSCQLVVKRTFHEWTLESNYVQLELMPSVAYLSSVSPQPLISGQPLMVNGGCFKQGYNAIHFLLGATDVSVPRSQIIEITGDFAVLTVPDMGPFAEATSGFIYIEGLSINGDINGDPLPCMYSPKIVRTFLPLDNLPDPYDFDFSQKGDGYHLHREKSYLVGSHYASYFWGFKDNDILFLTTCLENNWIVEDIIFSKQTGNGDVNIWESHKGTEKLYTKLHWWADAPSGGVIYWVSWKLKGPEGMPFLLNIPFPI